MPIRYGYEIEKRVLRYLTENNFDSLDYRGRFVIICEFMGKFMKEGSITDWGMDTSDLENKLRLYFFIPSSSTPIGNPNRYDIVIKTCELSPFWDHVKDVVDS